VLDPGTPDERVLSSKTPYLPLKQGTLVWLQSAGGGGYGNPAKRDRILIERDLRDGYISLEQARFIYGFEPGPG
jgi:N-methylhydantoinase B